MTTALARPALALPPAEFLTPTALILPPNLSFETWDEYGMRLRGLVSATSWLWGDWLNYGEDTYNERYSQALLASDLSYQTLRNSAYVCRHVSRERRRPELSFSIHAEVASLDEADQELLLNEAVATGLSRSEMRELVKRYKANLDAEINGKREVVVPPAVQEADAGVPPAEPEPEPEIDWQAEYAREAQERVSLAERLNAVTSEDDAAQKIARLHEQYAQALALVDQKNGEIHRLTDELSYRKRLLSEIMEVLHVTRYTEIVPTLKEALP